MKGHLRLLNIACAAKAKWRQITLQKASRESPLYFSVQGGSERGFGVFVEAVEPGSKAAEAGLKRGDQVGARGGKTQRCYWIRYTAAHITISQTLYSDFIAYYIVIALYYYITGTVRC